MEKHFFFHTNFVRGNRVVYFGAEAPKPEPKGPEAQKAAPTKGPDFTKKDACDKVIADAEKKVAELKGKGDAESLRLAAKLEGPLKIAQEDAKQDALGVKAVGVTSESAALLYGRLNRIPKASAAPTLAVAPGATREDIQAANLIKKMGTTSEKAWAGMADVMGKRIETPATPAKATAGDIIPLTPAEQKVVDAKAADDIAGRDRAMASLAARPPSKDPTTDSAPDPKNPQSTYARGGTRKAID